MGVVVFHSLSDTGQDFEFGAAGIHLFFGLSGFLMWTVTARSETSPARFVADRLRRIVPLYWIATLGAVASLWVVPGFFWQASADTARVAASLLFLPREGVAGGIYPVLYQGLDAAVRDVSSTPCSRCAWCFRYAGGCGP